jgi:hypothetical protein
VRSWIVVPYTAMDACVLAAVAVLLAVSSVGGIFLKLCAFSVVFVS